MKSIFLLLFIVTNYLSAIDLGTIATGSKTGMYYKLGNDISSLLKKYDMNLTVINTGGSYENIDILNGNYVKNKNTFFAIVQKDSISYYNYGQVSNENKSIYKKIPTILSLGLEDIHIIVNKDKEFDFINKTVYNVYCGTYGSGTCITAKYIEQAYGFEFNFINSTKNTILEKIKNNKIDLYFKVIQKPSIDLQDMKNVRLVELPNNLIMDKMYEKSSFSDTDYAWQENQIESYVVHKTLITNITDEKYKTIINNVVKILILNEDYLISNYGKHWKNINFDYINFKNMPSDVRKLIVNLSKN